jgi:hypothetical protein
MNFRSRDSRITIHAHGVKSPKSRLITQSLFDYL